MQEERLHIFDAIESNKRKSYLLIIGMFLFSLFFFWVLLSMFIDFRVSIFIALFISACYIVIAYTQGSSMIMGVAGGKPLERSKHPYVFHAIDGLSVAAGIPQPKAYVIDDPSPNAFATGTDPKKSSIAVTTGLLEKLDRREVSGVIAHEISHIANYDIKYMIIAIVMVGFVALLSQVFGRSLLYSRGGGRKGGAPFLILGIVMIVLAPIFAELVRFAISREREYLADANAAKLTRDPDALASALKKISQNSQPVKGASNVTAPLYIANPLKGKFVGLFATHPPIEERVKRLEKM